MQRGFKEAADKPRRFYKTAEVADLGDGFTVLLDTRRVRTPKGAQLVVPTRGLAEQIAGEWAAQTDVIEIATMHANRLANTALESIPQAREATAEQVAHYAASDLLCYFAEEPQALVQRQAERWGPQLERTERELGLQFVRACGIVHQTQPEATLQRVKALALELDDFSLAGLAFGTALFGSTVLGFAVQRGWLSGEEGFELSRLDEAWQEEKWGVDAEAAERTERMRGEAAMLDRWFRSLRG